MTLVGAALLAPACLGPTADDTGQTADDVSAIHYGVDYAWARPSLAGLRAQGFTFAARYLSYDTSGKNLSHPEAAALVHAGLDVVAVWEQNATDALSGYSRGVQDAQAAEQQALSDGAPASRPIYFAIDFDATAADQSAINSYFDGVAVVIGRARTGVYGGYYVVQRLFDAGKISFGWQTYAWSGGQWDPRAQLRQIENGIDGGQLDRDEAVAGDFGQWGAAVVDTGPPPAHPPLPTSCGAIEPGHGLSRGQAWRSCDRRFELAMQTDGNLVVASNGVPLWATRTTGHGEVVVMQTDGNLVLYSNHSRPLFTSRTNGHAGARLALQDDGNVVVYAGSHALWATGTGGMPPAPTTCGAIAPDHGLAVGEVLTSCDGQHALVQQEDGNLVVYHGAVATWDSNTSGTDGRQAVMQADGNLVVYGANSARWSSRTNGHSGASLALQDDGNLVIYAGGHAIWSTGTSGR